MVIGSAAVIGFAAIEKLPLRVSSKHSCEPLLADSLSA